MDGLRPAVVAAQGADAAAPNEAKRKVAVISSVQISSRDRKVFDHATKVIGDNNLLAYGVNVGFLSKHYTTILTAPPHKIVQGMTERSLAKLQKTVSKHAPCGEFTKLSVKTATKAVPQQFVRYTHQNIRRAALNNAKELKALGVHKICLDYISKAPSSSQLTKVTAEVVALQFEVLRACHAAVKAAR